MSTLPSPTGMPRRTFLAAACATGCLAAAGCSTGAATAGDNQADSARIAVSDVPVGGGIVLPQQQLVITQPQAGVFRAFSAVCTHQGCSVSEVHDGTINCPCHGSRYSITDGSVVRRPAQQPLDAHPVTRTGDVLSIG
ncbi:MULTISPECIES: Rieske (2Fe-2S) protein [Rhodococcus]|uniref:Rieske (2Fe-2S) protein n=1 Tax=Rhodococcus TaxID=1827 RepID=UPI0029546883|nr:MULTISPECIES: Rieske 2Fe-2S domain-containing protein [Rhodococcus]MDV7246573.1 Rieske 2Fe-2S domain-containing protein [Rhodococcus oxybenzonivorans]MDV7337585.1 Rieske 2Fe-2S domain-containing protein [Rhodococcus oxybenzonivorans]MDV8031405.1 Rieske 2Fe-2S domain-containing protein [Rhodococcus sp. IEGM 27]